MNEITLRVNDFLPLKNQNDIKSLASLFAPDNLNVALFENSEIKTDQIQKQLQIIVSNDTIRFFKSSIDFIRKCAKKDEYCFAKPKFSFVIKTKTQSKNCFTTTLVQAIPINRYTIEKTNTFLFTTSNVDYFIDFDFSNLTLKEIDIYNIENVKTHFFFEKNKEHPFSKREIEILHQIAQGFSYKQIADNLFISPNTANKHKENILKKLPGQSITQIISNCIKKGVIVLKQ